MREISVKKYEYLPYNDREIRRYLGVKSYDENIEKLIDECKAQCKDVFELAVCYSVFPVKVNGQSLDFNAFSVESNSLRKHFNGLSKTIIMVASVGFGIDRLIKKYSTLSPSKALIFSAIGSERVETLCDKFCQDMKGVFGCLMPRFSAGYGDLPIECQRDIFSVLEANKMVGVTLNDSMLISPTKSVSAFIGIGNGEGNANKCKDCNNSDCSFRKEYES